MASPNGWSTHENAKKKKWPAQTSMAECVRVMDGGTMGWRRDRRSKKPFHSSSMAAAGCTSQSFESEFGKKMLEKFGWADGQGLGASAEGRVEPLMLSRRVENMGVRELLDKMGF